MTPTLDGARLRFGGVGRTVKQQIRAQRRAARREIASARDLLTDGERIAEHLRPLLEDLRIGPGDAVTGYESLPVEPQIEPVCRVLAARGATVLVPITLPSFDLDWSDRADPARTPWGLDAITACRLVLIPALSVDTGGTRMGQAGGCYDRALPRARPGAVIVALLHPGELLPHHLPADPWDQPVDAVVSAEGLAWTTYGTTRHTGSGA